LRSYRYLPLGLVVCAWTFGLLTFMRADGHFEATLPRSKTPPAGLHNLSLAEFGPTVRASSYYMDSDQHHHPLFLVDGRELPLKVEKWTSKRGERRPWVEILWREPHDLERVIIHHAGLFESGALTNRIYSIRCLTADGTGPRVDVDKNEDAIATHPLVCHRARGVQIKFYLDKDDDLVRIYEVETWGR
jgi:hypothetical protein